MGTMTGKKPASVGRGLCPLQVCFLGRFQVWWGEEPMAKEEWPHSRAAQLFKYLVLNKDKPPIPQQQIFELFWPGMDEQTARHNLHVTVYNLRRILEPNLRRGSDSRFIITRRQLVSFNPVELQWFDVDSFLDCWEQGSAHYRGGDAAGAVPWLEKGKSLYQGELLPEDPYEEWVQPERERLERVYLDLLEILAYCYHRTGSTAACCETAKIILEKDLAREQVFQYLLRGLVKLGRRLEAVEEYRNYAKRLQEEYNMGPLKETRALYEELIAGEEP